MRLYFQKNEKKKKKKKKKEESSRGVARGHYRCIMPCFDLALGHSERALYRQQTKAI